MALALYRKYRPRVFSEVIGQEHVTEPLIQALTNDRLNHAYLFSGPRGCGKTSSARILARSLNCVQGPTPQPCGECESCRGLAPDGPGSIDVIEIDAASHGGVDDARELRERAFFAPAVSRYKVYIIDEAHMVSSAGFNALLKLVEEPPDYVKFVFATTEPEKVLGTIKSRTHHYPFRLIPPGVLRPYLEQLAAAEDVKVEPLVFPLVVRAGGGSARDTLSVLDQLIAGSGPDGVTYARAVALLGVTDVALIDEMVDALAAGDGGAAFATVDRLAEAGHDSRRFAGDLLQRIRDLIILRRLPEAVERGLLDAPDDELARMRTQAGQLGDATLSRYADILHNGLVEMRGATSPRLLLELFVARMLLPATDDSTSALLQRLERLEQGGSSSAYPASSTSSAPSPEPGVSPQAAARQVAARAAARSTPPPTPADPKAQTASSSPGEPPAESALDTGGAASSPAQRTTAGDTASPQGQTAPGGHDPSPARTPSGAASPQDQAVPVDNEPASRASSPVRASAGDDPGSATSGSASSTRGSGGGQAGQRGRGPVPEQAGQRGPVRVPAEPEPWPELARTGAGSAVPAGAAQTAAAGTTRGGGAVDAQSVRDAWNEILRMVGDTSKKAAAFAREGVVRDVEGNTLILLFRHKIHADGVSNDPAPLVEAIHQVFGGRWSVRCEIGGDQRSPGPGGARKAGAAAKSPAPAEEWSAPARPSAPAHDDEPPPEGDESPDESESGGHTPELEGFDPGDEPDLDTDSLAVRQTGEEQALESLRQSFNLEKIAETGS